MANSYLEATRGSAGRSHGQRVMNARTQIIVEKSFYIKNKISSLK